MDDAVALCGREGDNFYVTAFLIEVWLGEVTYETVAQHSEKKSAAKRRLQGGVARQVFDEIFRDVSGKEMGHLFGCLARFGEYDDAQSRLLRKAYGALALEYPKTSWPDLAAPPTRQSIAAAVDFMRQMCGRLCEWVEAIAHWQAHLFSFYEPQTFDPDSEKRELAILGVQQRHYPDMTASQKDWWLWHYSDAGDRFKGSPKWPTLGKAMAAAGTTGQHPAAVDQLIIVFWPLVKRHRWTYRDLMSVLTAILPPPAVYPCLREQELAAYCANVLGLRKSSMGPGKSAPDGRPPGFEVAWKLCQRKTGLAESS